MKLPLALQGSFYTYDYSTGPDKVIGGMKGYEQLDVNIYGMASGNGNAVNVVNQSDKTGVWSVQSGLAGYLSADYNLNAQADNRDKNQYWKPNLGKGSTIP
jgi:hypothetical protein